MTETENAPLVHAMKAIAADRNEATWRALFDALEHATLVVPVRVADGEPVGDDEGVEIAVSDGEGGAPRFFAFTGVPQLHAMLGEQTPYSRIDAPDLARVALGYGGSGVVVDGASPYGGELSPRDLELVAERVVPESADADTLRTADDSSLVVRPARGEPPQALLDALERMVADDPGVRGAWIFEGALGSGPPHPFVGLEPAGGAGGDALRPSLERTGQAIAQAIPADAHVDLVPLEGELLDVVRRVGTRVGA